MPYTPAPNVKRRPLTEEDKKQIDALIHKRLRPVNEPLAAKGNYHELVCDLPVIDDPPGTPLCTPCPG